MKKYIPEYKSKTSYNLSFNFTLELDDDEGDCYHSVLAIEKLKELIDTENIIDLGNRVEIWEVETEEYEVEPDWDMLPGGKDYD